MREDKGMTQAELSEKSGVSIRVIQAFERGARDINKAQVVTVLELAEALECDIYEIINNR
jgi:transcriptional regulator with XRE-family HTH domain